MLAGAAAVLVAAAGVSFAALESGYSRDAGGAQLVTSVIVLLPHFPGETFAPPPASATPALTAHQAAVRAEGLPPGKAIPSYVTVQLGLYTLPVGPVASCGSGCKGDTIVNGTAYSSYRVLAYGFSRSECAGGPARPSCTQWDFVNANTGKYIAGLTPH